IIDIRITASGETEKECTKMLDEMEANVLNILDKHFFGYGSTRIQDIVFEQLAFKNESMSLIEIHTDGEVLDSLAHEMTNQEAFKGGLYRSEERRVGKE